MFASKFYIDTNRNNALMLRITSNRKKAELALGFQMDEETLADSLSGKPKPQNSRWRSLLLSYQVKLDELRIELAKENAAQTTASDIRDMFKRIISGMPAESDPECGSDTPKWEHYYRNYVESKKNKSYKASCQYTLDKMRDFDPDLPRLTFDDISLKWLKDFDEWLDENGSPQNTRNIHFKNIRTCLNRAIDEELTTNYPFRRFKIRPEATRKRNLPVEELRKLFDYEVEPYQELYRDMFKLIFFLIGINTVDLHRLKEITKDGRIEYKRAKTKKLYSIKVEPEALALIKKYKGTSGLLSIADRWKDHRDFQKYCNIALKKIGQVERRGRGGKKTVESEWPDLSTYFARYSWATIAYNDCGIPKDVISQALGHSWGSSVTETYLNRDQRLVDEANRKVLDWVLYGKRQ